MDANNRKRSIPVRFLWGRGLGVPLHMRLSEIIDASRTRESGEGWNLRMSHGLWARLLGGSGQLPDQASGFGVFFATMALAALPTARDRPTQKGVSIASTARATKSHFTPLLTTIR